ncbi:MAG TPA: tetratricopeptide repeat protein [Planctomycetes bacterium]|nr:tetratricopeptide repeat protein [Planctomycetota bacterium]
MRAALVAILVCCLTAILPAQQGIHHFEAKKVGRREFLLTVKATDVPAMEILSRVAEETGLRLTLNGGPDVSRTLDEKKLDIHVEAVPMGAFVEMLGGGAGLHSEINKETGAIVISRLPATDAPEAFEFYRKQAIDSLVEAYGGDSDPDREEKLLLANARLFIAGGDYENALEALDKYVAAYKGEPEKAPSACLDAARCALILKRATDAIRLTDIFMQEWPRHVDTGKARILRARALMLQGNILGAMAMLESMIGTTKRRMFSDRDAVTAEFMLANLHHELGENEKAVQILGDISWRHDPEKTHDLLARIPLYMGICRRAAGDQVAAVRDFRLAALTVKENELRIRALTDLAQTFLDVDSPFEALASIRVAKKLAPEPTETIRLERIAAHAFQKLGLDIKGLDVLLTVLEALEKGSLQVPDAKKSINDVISDLGAMLTDLGDWDRALEAFLRLRSQGRVEPRVTWMIARCRFETGAYREALAELETLRKNANDEKTLLMARRLEGDCYERMGLHELALRTWQEAGR